MVTFPSPESITGPSSMRPNGMVEPADYQGIARGAKGLAQGIDTVGAVVGQFADQQRQQENAVDLSRAEWFKTARLLDIQNRAATDTDYATFGKRYEPEIGGAFEEAAKLIRDDKLRERWIADQEVSRLQNIDAIHDHGVAIKQDFEVSALEQSLLDNSRMIADPTVPKPVRDKLRNDMVGTIQTGIATGLIKPSHAADLRERFVRGSDNALALNLAELDIAAGREQYVMTGVAIPGVPGTAGASILNAQAAVDGGPPVLDFSLGKMTAELIGDANFPDDPKLAAAYLSDPAVALEYAEAAQAHLSDRYKGDLTAVVVAMDPNGGTELADRWVASGHKEWTLPPAVRNRYRKTMASMAVEQPRQRIPIEADPGVDLGNTDPAVLDRFEQLQSQFGMPIRIISGARDATHNAEVGGAEKSKHLDGSALDIDVKDLDEAQRVKLIEMASAMGFTGIGVYANSLHLDTGELRAWGPDHHAGSEPAWAKEAIALHLSGQTKELPALYTGVAPEYAALTFDQRLTLYNKAKSGLNDKSISMRSSLSTIVDNAPAAIGATGRYDGDLPSAAEFVQAWGAADGIQRYKAFEANIDVAKQVYGMSTMSNDDIKAALAAAQPVSSGNNAKLEQERFNAISQAADAALKARAADPAGYTIGSFPGVAKLFQAAQDDPAQLPIAINALAEAEKQLGIENPEYLPKSMAAGAVATFKDATLPAQQRTAAIAGAVLATSDHAQQDAIFDQLKREGLPNYTAGVLDAMRRGDTGAAANLTRAVLFDMSDVKYKRPASDGMSDEKIQEALLDKVFGEGDIGNVVYGGTGGDTESMTQIAGASELLFRAAKLRIIDGTASNLDDAIAGAARDLFGDVQVVNGGGVKVTVPSDVDQGAVRKGFSVLMPQVRRVLTNVMATTFPPSASPGMQLATGMTAQNHIDAVMSEGYFTNGDGYMPNGEKGFVFYDPTTDAVVTDKDGKPVLFSMDDLMNASEGANDSYDSRYFPRSDAPVIR